MLSSFSKFLLEQGEGELVCQEVSLLVLYLCKGCWQPPFSSLHMEAWECHAGSNWTSITLALKPQARPGQHFSIKGSPSGLMSNLEEAGKPRICWYVFSYIQQFTLPVTAWSSHGRRRRRRQIVTLLHVWAVCPSLIRAVVPHGSFAQQL